MSPRRWMIALATLTALVAVACKHPPAADPVAQRNAAEPAVAALRTADFARASTTATEVLTADGRNPVAAGVRALARYQQAGSRLRDELIAALEATSKGFDHARFRGIWQRFADDLATVEADLAIAADPGFNLELCLACWKHDWNHSGDIDDGDRLLFQIEVDATGAELPEGDPRRTPTFHFDVGDVHWARAMVGFQRAALEVILAYKWEQLDQLFFSLMQDRPPPITIVINEPARIQRARDLILAGLDHAERSRVAYLAETDDDREWVPSPTQRDHPVPLPVDQALYDTWAGVVGDVRRLIAGEEGLSIAELARLGDDDWENPPGGFVDIHAMLEHPGNIEIDPTSIERLDDAGQSSPAAAEAVLREVLGRALVPKMKPSPLVGRLARMRGELDRDEDSFERKLRYFLWLN